MTNAIIIEAKKLMLGIGGTFNLIIVMNVTGYN
jgi:hypothetical protein